MKLSYSFFPEGLEVTMEEAKQMLKEHNEGTFTMPPNMLKLIKEMVENE